MGRRASEWLPEPVNDDHPSYLIDGYESHFYALRVGERNDLCEGKWLYVRKDYDVALLKPPYAVKPLFILQDHYQ